MLKNLTEKIDLMRARHVITLDYSWQVDARGFPTHGADSAYDTSLESSIDAINVLLNSQLNRLQGFLVSDKSSK